MPHGCPWNPGTFAVFWGKAEFIPTEQHKNAQHFLVGVQIPCERGLVGCPKFIPSGYLTVRKSQF